MGTFSDPQHTHLGIFILKSPPLPPPPGRATHKVHFCERLTIQKVPVQAGRYLTVAGVKSVRGDMGGYGDDSQKEQVVARRPETVLRSMAPSTRGPRVSEGGVLVLDNYSIHVQCIHRPTRLRGGYLSTSQLVYM